MPSEWDAVSARPSAADSVLYASDRSRIVRRHLPGAGGSILVKQPLGQGALQRLRAERHVLERLAAVPAVPHLAAPQTSDALALEDTWGMPLRDELVARSLSAAALLDIGRQLARTLTEVHRCGVLHRNIHPSNIVLVASGHRTRTFDAMLVGFGLATTIAEQQPACGHHTQIAGSLPHLAPEQTGRTGRSVDLRADLYGLGATLYEMVTGQAPFLDGDPLQLIHKILAQAPAPPTELAPATSPALSAIVMRLLEKEPDRRYQSAEGLAHDLGLLRDRLAAGETDAFALGDHDFGSRLSPPSRPIGRDAELAALSAAFTGAMRGGGRGVLVGGSPGVGKTMLINQLRPLVMAQRGWFVMGKFDPHRRELAADAVHQAFRALGRLLLAEPESQLAALRPQMLLALGPNAGLIAALLPEFALLLGVDPEPVSDDPIKAERRLVQGGLDLLRTVASPARPVVLVVDDLQWAAAVPLAFIDAVLTDNELCGVLLVGAYRESEVGATHPLAALRDRWQRLGAAPLSIGLRNLPPADLREFIGEMLRLPTAQADRLAQALCERTAGNPCDTVELINALRHDGALVRDHGGWHWDAATIRRHIGAGNVADLLAARIERLPQESRDTLATMACLGGVIPLDLLCAASDVPAETLGSRVAPALEDGLLVMESSGGAALRFRHDRVQQAASARIDVPTRLSLQLAIARRLAAHAEFGIVAAQQYLAAIDAVHDMPERRRVAHLLHSAATQARHNNNALAERLLSGASGLLAQSREPADIALMQALAIDRHAALYALGRLEETDAVYDSIARAVLDPLQRAAADAIQISSLTNGLRPREAVALGLRVLAELGIEPPRGDAGADLAQRLNGVCRWIDESSEAEDLQRTPMDDARDVAVAQIINRVMPAAFFCDAATMAWLTLESHRLWIARGPCAALLGSLGGLSVFTIAWRGDYRSGHTAARRAVLAGEALGWDLGTGQARVALSALASHWREPLEEAALQAQLGSEALLRGGDLQFAGYAQLTLLTASLDCAATLDEFRSQLDAVAAFAARAGNEHTAMSCSPYRQLALALRGETRAEGSFSDTLGDEGAQLACLVSSPVAAAHYHVLRALSAALFGQVHALSRYSASAMKLLPIIQPTYPVALAHVLRALALAEDLKQAVPARPGELLTELDDSLDWLRGRAVDAPVNFSHLAKLVEAERAWACGEHLGAACAFDAALREGEARQRPWHNALIAERAALFLLAHGMTYAGRQMLCEAHHRYAAWGASAKVRQLEQAHAFLRRAGAPPHERTREAHHAVSTDALDMLGVVRASQALSSETSLERLRLRVVDLLGGMTGATAVQVLLWSADTHQWLLPQPGSDGTSCNLTAAEAAARGLLPLSVLRYVERTREPLLVEDAAVDDRFVGDPYLSDAERCSILAVPILQQGAMRAMLLLENRLARGAFTADRLDAVMLITGQLAVSLANAQLYEQLEQRVSERTRELQEAQTQLLAAARQAGMAEIATNVLHNVGNVLNSVNVSADMVDAQLRSSKVKGLARAAQLMDEHADDLGDFLTRDARGRLLPAYLRELAQALELEHQAMAQEVRALGKSVNHIKEIVATQQSYAGTPRVVELLKLNELVDDALRMNVGALARHKVNVVRQIAELPALPLDRHRVLQILVNLISNAKHALSGLGDHGPCITLGANLDGRMLRITVADNGEGIAPENLTRVFSHGFTTRKNGHGFGLHSCALAAHEMGGQLHVCSEGRGRGATFILELPIDCPEGK